MRYFLPDLILTDTASPEHEHFGGVPVGLPPERWPRCVECGGSQTLLAQLSHDPDRLDLGRSGRTLFMFQCMHDVGVCATWEAFSGANACLVMFLTDNGLARRPVSGVFYTHQIETAVTQLQQLLGLRLRRLPGGVVLMG